MPGIYFQRTHFLLFFCLAVNFLMICSFDIYFLVIVCFAVKCEAQLMHLGIISCLIWYIVGKSTCRNKRRGVNFSRQFSILNPLIVVFKIQGAKLQIFKPVSKFADNQIVHDCSNRSVQNSVTIVNFKCVYNSNDILYYLWYAVIEYNHWSFS